MTYNYLKQGEVGQGSSSEASDQNTKFLTAQTWKAELKRVAEILSRLRCMNMEFREIWTGFSG